VWYILAYTVVGVIIVEAERTGITDAKTDA